MVVETCLDGRFGSGMGMGDDHVLSGLEAPASENAQRALAVTVERKPYG